MDILKSLNQYIVIIEDYQIQDYRHWTDGFYYKLVIRFKNGSELHAREYMDAVERDYPRHKHTCDGIFENVEISLQDVLNFIAHTI